MEQPLTSEGAAPGGVRRTDLTSLTFDVTGMTCAACAARIERVVARAPGVARVSVNLPLERADVTVEAGTGSATITNLIEQAGFGATPRTGSAAERRRIQDRLAAERRAEDRRTVALFLLSAILTLPLVVPMLLQPLGIAWHLSPAWEMALATPVQFWVGWRFYRGAWKALAGGGANMDVLVALGTSAAYAFSAAMVWIHGDHAHGHLYFEGAAVVITLVLLGKVLEAWARRGTTRALTALAAIRPQTARLVSDAGTADVPVEILRPGDRLMVQPGERFPVDGVIESGETEADESLVTGESHPVVKRTGDAVITGAVNGVGAVMVVARATGEDTTLARITRLVEAAQTGKAPVQRLVDRISAVFVPIVIGLACAAFGGWLWAGADLETALVAAVSVLVIACPCALGLATPAALVTGTGAAARVGILVKDIETLERAARVDTVVFDKTGTLTEGRPRLVALAPEPGVSADDLLRVAASLQAGSEHPIGRAIHAEGLARTTPQSPLTQPVRVRATVGEGISGEVDGQLTVAGRPAFVKRQGISAVPSEGPSLPQGSTIVAVGWGSRMMGRIALADTPRVEAAEAIATLRGRGIRTVMLTGDTADAAGPVAVAVGLSDADVIAGVRPEGKVAVIDDLTRQGRHPAMVGDGLNDAPALARAAIGIAMGTGAAAAIESAPVTLMRPDPRLVPAALDIAARTVSKIRQNLFWAFAYNVIGLPLAAFGLLSPSLAGAAMALSSVSVVTNSLLLNRWRPLSDRTTPTDDR